MKNKYIKVSHISEVKFKEIVKLFSEDLSATQIANLIKIKGPFRNLCQTGKITITQEDTDEYRNRCGAICL